MPVIKAGAFDLDYTDVGTGPAVVLVHCSASGHRQWRHLVDALQSRYRLIAVNLFGYGKTSPWPDDRPLTFVDQVALIEAAAALSPEPVVLVGHSLGGAVAFEAAARMGRRVRMLVAFEPILFYLLKTHGPASAYREIAQALSGFIGQATRGDWTGAGESFVDYWSGPGAWAAMPEERKANTLPLLPPVAHEWTMMEAPGTHTLAEFGAIACPVHLITAADTRAPTREIVKLLAKTYPAWHVHEIAAGGHMAPLGRSDLVNPLIAKILDETFRR